jgi:DNA-binding transcriptional regulator YdaS (Cro superfamily)
MHSKDLRTYLDDLPRGALAQLAAGLGISAIYVSQLAARQNDREPSPALCVAIERETGGVVTRRRLRPNDWWLIWPELVNDEFPVPALSDEA